MAFGWGEVLKDFPRSAQRPLIESTGPWLIECCAVVALAIIWCLSIVAQTSKIRKSLVIGVHSSWIVILTWYGWFSTASPFRVHELRVAGLFDGADITPTIGLYYARSFSVYVLLLVLYTGIPLVLSRFPIAYRVDSPPQGAAEMRFLIISMILFVVSLLNGAWKWLIPLIGWDQVEALRGIGFLGGLFLVCSAAGRGSVRGLLFGLAEVAIAPAAWLVR
jgi:hypothetical protein